MFKHKFETWLEKQKMSENAASLFDESIRCYKAQAFRASLLFSYLGFLTTLKERILAANKPAQYVLTTWNRLGTLLQDDSKWEEAVFNATQEKAQYDSSKTKIKDAVFSIRDNLRTDILYWKNCRNDCAHAKDNKIDSYNVETFWNFLESNLSKITVEGGKDSLLKKIDVHYDTSYTPAGKDVMPLIFEINSSIETNDLPSFWNSVHDILGNRAWHLEDEENKFFEKVFSLQIDRLSKSLLEFLKHHMRGQRMLLNYLSYKPNAIAQIGFSEAEIRNFWHTMLQRTNKPLSIYAAMLGNGMIPDAELADAHKEVIAEYNVEVKYPENANEQHILKDKGFVAALEQIAFEEGAIDEWEWPHKRWTILKGLMEYYPLSKQIVEKICNIYSTDTHKRFGRSLEALFTHNAQKKAEFKSIAAANGYILPQYLPSLV